jgi:hypothetical protein
MTNATDLLLKWHSAAPHREWSLGNNVPYQGIYIELVEGIQHVRKRLSEEIIETAQIDVLQMTVAEMIERLAYGLAAKASAEKRKAKQQWQKVNFGKCNVKNAGIHA